MEFASSLALWNTPFRRRECYRINAGSMLLTMQKLLCRQRLQLCVWRLLHGSLSRSFHSWLEWSKRRSSKKQTVSRALAQLCSRLMAAAFWTWALRARQNRWLANSLASAVAKRLSQTLLKAYKAWQHATREEVQHYCGSCKFIVTKTRDKSCSSSMLAFCLPGDMKC